MIAQCEPSPNLGGGKAQFHLANEYSKKGHQVELLGPVSMRGKIQSEKTDSNNATFNRYLKKHTNAFDIIEYDHCFIPDPSVSQSCSALLVARSVLFKLHADSIKTPGDPRIAKRINSLIRSVILLRSKPNSSTKTILNALSLPDLINVSSSRDVTAATSCGIRADKIICQPYALTAHELDSLRIRTTGNNVVFLGTFDFRKGCTNIAKTFAHIHSRFPQTRLKLLGAKGLMQTEQEILGFFPRKLRESVDVFLRFDRSELPTLLQDCKLAIFPSYWEGFGFSVLETLAAGIPTLAYDAPGPCDILPPSWLFPVGDFQKMGSKACELLSDSSDEHANAAREYGRRFSWPAIAEATLDAYAAALTEKRALRKAFIQTDE